MLKKIKNLVVEEEGQALTEYGLVVGLLVAVIVTGVALMNGAFSTLFSKVSTLISGAL
jgi:pilus assembly protein Flp/PilA